MKDGSLGVLSRILGKLATASKNHIYYEVKSGGWIFWDC